MFKKIMKRLFNSTKYNYVCDCPRCGSPKTGYVLNNRDVINLNIEREKVDRLLNGEIVEIHSFVDNENILFCLECGLEWSGIPEIKYLTDEEIENERKRRGIDDEFIMERNFTFENILYLRKKMRKEKKREKKLAQKKQETVKVKTTPTLEEQIIQKENPNTFIKDLAEKELILMRGPKFKSFKFK